MIAATVELSTSLKANLTSLIDLTAFGDDVASLATFLTGTIDDPAFPGALIPLAIGSEVMVVVVAPSQRDWRRLAPLLRAFAGPTLTSFSGLPENPPSGLAASGIISSAAPSVTSMIRVPTAVVGRIAALRALKRLIETVRRSPDLRRGAPEPTSWLLSRFQDYLNLGRMEPAQRTLALLRTELRLDALNLGALEVQLRAAFGDWSGIVNLPIFANLCMARRTPATTALLLEALYHVHLETAFASANEDAVKALYESAVRPLAYPMLSLPVSANAGDPVWRLLGLEAWLDPTRADLAHAASKSGANLTWLSSLIIRPVDDRPEAPTPVTVAPETLDVARGALAEVGRTESLDAIGSALAALSHLTPAELDQLRTAEPFRSLLQTVDAERAFSGLPGNWTEWFGMIRDPAFTTALEVARAGPDEWSIESLAADPVYVADLVAAIEAAQNDVLASERSTIGLPYVVAWLKKDPAFPRPSLQQVYSVLLTLLVLSPSRGRSTHESSYLLVHALLSFGPAAQAYRDLISDVRDLAGDGFGLDMAYWLLEVIEDFMKAGAADNEARTTFLHEVLSKLAPLYGRLSSLQRGILTGFAEELGWSLPALGVPEAVGGASTGDALSNALVGKRIAIYTLTETTSRQAKTLIENAAPGAIVDCNADHGGTLKLKALAENADLFVLVWQSAKHAASDCIRDHRGDKPLVYASGRGVSSILRAVEDHFATAA